MLTEYVLDGSQITSLESFFAQVSRVMIPGVKWGHNLDAFNDILRGGFGTPENGFTIKWINSAISRENLGYAETVRQLEIRLKSCRPSNRKQLKEDLESAQSGVGPTVLDWVVRVILKHCDGCEEAEDNVHLILA